MRHIGGVRTTRLTLLTVILLLTPLLAVVRPQPAAAAGVVPECTEAALRAALAGGGLVTFSCSGVIPLAGQLEISEDTTIDGDGRVTLDGQDATRLIQVNGGVALTLIGLTLTNGNGNNGLGGAIYNSGSLTISAGVLTGNAAPGGAWGGAIYNDGGVVTISHSTLSDNVAGAFGGAIFNATNGTVTLTASTLSGNSVNIGGAIFNNSNATVMIVAGTLSGNSANLGAAIYNGGALTLTTSTLAGNSANDGGAIFTFSNLGGSATLTANILSSDRGICVGPISSAGYNVAGDATCNLAATGDLQFVNPLLGNLANNGGPTETFMPQPGSPALDRVPNALCVTLSVANNGRDQRGAPRPESAGLPCDSGSVERQVNSYFCVGERSGTLRYFTAPNGCVRGEYRLMQSADGQYAFCVGERSGSLRYLTNSASCARGEWKLTLPQVDPITICVGERSRTARYVAEAGLCNARGELEYAIVNPAG